LDICDRLRKAGIYDEDLPQYEVHVLEQFDPDAAVRLLQDWLVSHPDDLATQLHLSAIALRIGRNELVRSDLSLMPPPRTVAPFLGAVAVQILKTQGKPNEALQYAYELLRLNFLDPVAHRAYQFVLLPFGPMPTIDDHETVQANSAVTILEDGTGEEHTFVIEPVPTDGRRFQDELPPTTTLAQELIGKRTSDSVVLASGSLGVAFSGRLRPDSSI
jgi:hypothetical protein